MTPPRDTQRTRLYEAERRAFPEAPEFDTFPEVEDYVRSVTATRWWRNRWKPPVEVRRGRGDMAWARRWAGSDSLVSLISLPPWAWTRYVILHELAHILTPDGKASHGPEYVANYLAMIRRFEPDLAPALEAEFKAGRIRRRRKAS